MPGYVYERTPKEVWEDDWPARRCTIHGRYEMHHSCAGGVGEPLGYCEAWDGTMLHLKIDEEGEEYGGYPNCTFEDDDG